MKEKIQNLTYNLIAFVLVATLLLLFIGLIQTKKELLHQENYLKEEYEKELETLTYKVDSIEKSNEILTMSISLYEDSFLVSKRNSDSLKIVLKRLSTSKYDKVIEESNKDVFEHYMTIIDYINE